MICAEFVEIDFWSDRLILFKRTETERRGTFFKARAWGKKISSRVRISEKEYYMLLERATQ